MKTIKQRAAEYAAEIKKETDYKGADIHLEYAFREGADFMRDKAIKAACLLCNSCDHCLRDKNYPFECDELSNFRESLNN